MTVSVLWLFLMVPWVGLQCVIVVFPDHTHLLFCVNGVKFECQYDDITLYLKFSCVTLCRRYSFFF